MASTSGSTHSSTHSSPHRNDVLPPVIGLEIEDPLEWSTDFTILKSFDCEKPQDFKLKLETGVTNGDCLPACLCATMECLHRGYVLFEDKEPAAAQLRMSMITWIKNNWTNYPIFNPEMQVQEMMWMQHDMGITAEERRMRGEWGEDPAARLAAYTDQCDKIYFSDTEMLLFSCMVHEKQGVPLVFRTWRCTGREQQKGEFITMVPDRAVLEMNGITEAIVVDLAHVGKLDGSSAHYKVLDAGSLEGLQEVKDLRRKRRRLTKHSDISDEQRVRLGTSYASVPLSSTMVTLGPDASI